MGGSGGETNQSIENTFNFKALNENITNIITNNSSTTSASGANIQGMKVNFGVSGVSFGKKLTDGE